MEDKGGSADTRTTPRLVAGRHCAELAAAGHARVLRRDDALSARARARPTMGRGPRRFVGPRADEPRVDVRRSGSADRRSVASAGIPRRTARGRRVRTATPRAGVALVGEATDQPWGHRTLFFRDPDGNVLEIYADL